MLNIAVTLASKSQVQRSSRDVKEIWSLRRDIETVIPQLLSTNIYACRMYDVDISTMTSMSDKPTASCRDKFKVVPQTIPTVNVANTIFTQWIVSSSKFDVFSPGLFLEHIGVLDACCLAHGVRGSAEKDVNLRPFKPWPLILWTSKVPSSMQTAQQ